MVLVKHVHAHQLSTVGSFMLSALPLLAGDGDVRECRGKWTWCIICDILMMMISAYNIHPCSFCSEWILFIALSLPYKIAGFMNLPEWK
jgi:hypothetical protein